MVCLCFKIFFDYKNGFFMFKFVFLIIKMVCFPFVSLKHYVAFFKFEYMKLLQNINDYRMNLIILLRWIFLQLFCKVSPSS